MTPRPPVVQRIGEAQRPAGVFGYGADDAGYIVGLERFERVRLLHPQGKDYEWPLGMEGFDLSGSQQQGIHHYIGDNAPVVQVTHMDDARVTLSGVFPGSTGADNMQDLRSALRQIPPDDGFQLILPSSLTRDGDAWRPLLVFIENYRFTHEEGDRSGTIAYEVNFIQVGTANRRLKKPHTTAPPANPRDKKAKPKGRGATSTRYFTVKAGYRTLRQIAKKVYGDADKWKKLYDLNKYAISSGAAWGLPKAIPASKIPTVELPIGFQVAY
jgi:hypothetical protein